MMSSFLIPFVCPHECPRACGGIRESGAISRRVGSALNSSDGSGDLATGKVEIGWMAVPLLRHLRAAFSLSHDGHCDARCGVNVVREEILREKLPCGLHDVGRD